MTSRSRKLGDYRREMRSRRINVECDDAQRAMLCVTIGGYEPE